MSERLGRSGRTAVCMVPLVDIWSGMCGGSLALVEHFVTEDIDYAVLQERCESDALAHRLTPGQADVLVRLVTGQRQKSAALEIGVSNTAVTLRAQRCIHRLGFDCKPSRLPMFLVLAALASTGRAVGAPAAMVERHDCDVHHACLYGVRRVDNALPTSLSRAEQEIARMIAEGRPVASIAEHRRTAARTVANQVKSIFAKLGVSSRLELLALLFFQAQSQIVAI